MLLWLFVLDPTASPVSGLLRALGFDSFVQVIAPGNLPVVFTVVAFWTGAGGWIVIMYGALNNISAEVIEAARVDGANAVQIAWSIQLPMLRKWISYMGIMSLAAGTQLFVEPQLLSQASNAVVPNDYSLNQLAYQYAFQQNDFNGAAAISLLLLVIALALSAVFVTRGGCSSGTDHMSSAHRATATSSRPGLTGWSGRAVIGVMVAVFVLFFAIPIVWLLLATTKTARG